MNLKQHDNVNVNGIWIKTIVAEKIDSEKIEFVVWQKLSNQQKSFNILSMCQSHQNLRDVPIEIRIQELCVVGF